MIFNMCELTKVGSNTHIGYKIYHFGCKQKGFWLALT